ncbi:MAG: HAD family hydrolase [Alphaproteobacteria bacterium]|nr:HAD family hydrolase [Alphaproteobacteria bacterium]
MLLSKNKLLYALFDWDGTLSDNRNVVIEAMNNVLKEYNLGSWEDVRKLRNPRLSLWDNFVNFFGSQSTEAYEEYVRIYKRISPQYVKAFPYASEVINILKEIGVEVMIMTNKDRRLLEIELPLLYNPDIFSRIVCGHEAPKDKPYPEHIFYTLRGLLTPTEINQQNVWMIGDSNQDGDCALSAGALPIMINKNLFTDDVDKTSSVLYFQDFSSLYDALQK